jgi:DNA-binding MarR family transcriptional regulator
METQVSGRDGRTVHTPVDLRDPVEADIAYRVALAWRELRRGASASALRDHFYGENALDQSQIDALDVLMTRDEWRMSELAEALRVDPSTATRAVQRLVNDGLAERRACGDDGRVVLVVPSTAGRREHRAISKRRGVALSRLLGAFDAPERQLLAELFERFVAELDTLAVDLGVATGPGVPRAPVDDRPVRVAAVADRETFAEQAMEYAPQLYSQRSA